MTYFFKYDILFRRFLAEEGGKEMERVAKINLKDFVWVELTDDGLEKLLAWSSAPRSRIYSGGILRCSGNCYKLKLWQLMAMFGSLCINFGDDAGIKNLTVYLQDPTQ